MTLDHGVLAVPHQNPVGRGIGVLPFQNYYNSFSLCATVDKSIAMS